MFEGSRAFDIAWGSVSGALCLAVALAWLLPLVRPGASFFGARTDPGRRLQFAYGLFAMFMAFTNVGCRYIPHAYLSGVHEGFAAITFVVLAGLGPLALAHQSSRRRASPA